MNFAEMVHWNNNSYGNAVRVKRSTLLGVFIAACIVTPATNWIIPFAKKIVRSDFVYRYEASQ